MSTSEAITLEVAQASGKVVCRDSGTVVFYPAIPTTSTRPPTAAAKPSKTQPLPNFEDEDEDEDTTVLGLALGMGLTATGIIVLATAESPVLGGLFTIAGMSITISQLKKSTSASPWTLSPTHGGVLR